MSNDLPPPLTSKSSRSEMWENIQSMQEEIESQQQEIREWKAIAEQAKRERAAAIRDNTLLSHQLSVVRSVVSLTVQPRPATNT